MYRCKITLLHSIMILDPVTDCNNRDQCRYTGRDAFHTAGKCGNKQSAYQCSPVNAGGKYNGHEHDQHYNDKDLAEVFYKPYCFVIFSIHPGKGE